VDVADSEEADRWCSLTEHREASSAGEAPESILRLYAIAVEMADRVSARRATANTFFLALQTGLAAALGAFAIRGGAGGGQQARDTFVLVLAATAGLILAAAWFLLLRSYRKLNAAKFSVINEIENAYFDVRPFVDEWTLLKQEDRVKRRWRDRYTELSFIEQAVPGAFAVLYLILAIYLAAQ
jgi:hypothetical protein